MKSAVHVLFKPPFAWQRGKLLIYFIVVRSLIQIFARAVIMLNIANLYAIIASLGNQPFDVFFHSLKSKKIFVKTSLLRVHY